MLSQTPIKFISQHRARFSETDPNGHVNSQHYLTYFLEHRFIGMREKLGLDLAAIGALPVAFFLREAKLNFVRPLFADQPFEIKSYVGEFNGKSAIVLGAMALADGRELASCRLELVCINKNTSRPCDWPNDFMKRFYEEVVE